jgi:hypothetical protein
MVEVLEKNKAETHENTDLRCPEEHWSNSDPSLHSGLNLNPALSPLAFLAEGAGALLGMVEVLESQKR